jgi:hypothetical protein
MNKSSIIFKIIVAVVAVVAVLMYKDNSSAHKFNQITRFGPA